MNLMDSTRNSLAAEEGAGITKEDHNQAIRINPQKGQMTKDSGYTGLQRDRIREGTRVTTNQTIWRSTRHLEISSLSIA